MWVVPVGGVVGVGGGGIHVWLSFLGAQTLTPEQCCCGGVYDAQISDKKKEQSERLARECELPFAPDRFSSPIMAPASVFGANFSALVSIAHAP